jgi:hypothetical protein
MGIDRDLLKTYTTQAIVAEPGVLDGCTDDDNFKEAWRSMSLEGEVTLDQGNFRLPLALGREMTCRPSNEIRKLELF